MPSWSNFVKEKQVEIQSTDTWTDLVKGGGVDNEEKQEKQEKKNKRSQTDKMQNREETRKPKTKTKTIKPKKLKRRKSIKKIVQNNMFQNSSKLKKPFSVVIYCSYLFSSSLF